MNLHAYLPSSSQMNKIWQSERNTWYYNIIIVDVAEFSVVEIVDKGHSCAKNFWYIHPSLAGENALTSLIFTIPLQCGLQDSNIYTEGIMSPIYQLISDMSVIAGDVSYSNPWSKLYLTSHSYLLPFLQ